MSTRAGAPVAGAPQAPGHVDLGGPLPRRHSRGSSTRSPPGPLDQRSATVGARTTTRPGPSVRLVQGPLDPEQGLLHPEQGPLDPGAGTTRPGALRRTPARDGLLDPEPSVRHPHGDGLLAPEPVEGSCGRHAPRCCPGACTGSSRIGAITWSLGPAYMPSGLPRSLYGGKGLARDPGSLFGSLPSWLGGPIQFPGGTRGPLSRTGPFRQPGTLAEP
jgi:hypothetical protein